MNRTMQWLFKVFTVCLLMNFLVPASVASTEWKENVLYSFQGIADGAFPVGSIVFDSAGNLYGATRQGGASTCLSPYQCGTIFQLVHPAKKGDPWVENVLHIFQGNTNNDGASPFGGLLIDSAGNLYGTTSYGGTGNCVLLGILVGCGTVFEFSPPAQKGGAWTETVLYSFPTSKQGYAPIGDLVFDSKGNLYGATIVGGGRGTTCDPFYQYCGAVFELSPPKKKGGAWTEKTLHGFAGGTDGANPNGGLVLDSAGAIYGTTYGGGNEGKDCGSGGCGIAFELKPPAKKGGSWTEKKLHVFVGGNDGAWSTAGVVFDSNGDLYGVTVGTLFQLAPKKSGRWTETILYTFNGNALDPEGGLIFDIDGNLYGTTNVGGGQSLHGTVFRLKPPTKKGKSWIFTVLHGFLGPPDGDFPAASLIFDKNGNLYSTTNAGGTGTGCGFSGCGTVFEVEP